MNGRNYLSAILTHSNGIDPTGRAVILNDALQVAAVHQVPAMYAPFNMHEFKVIENGAKALQLITRTDVADIRDVSDTELKAGLIVNMAAREVDLATDETTFEWWVHPTIGLNESNAENVKRFRGPFPDGWDWL